MPKTFNRMAKRPVKRRIIVEPKKEEATFENAQGLGDTIEAITTMTGIKKGVELLSKALDWDCGCDERKEKLNKIWSYRKPKCLIQEDYEYLKEFFAKPQNHIVPQVQWELMDIYERIFGIRLEASNCASCWRDYISQIRQFTRIRRRQCR